MFKLLKREKTQKVPKEGSDRASICAQGDVGSVMDADEIVKDLKKQKQGFRQNYNFGVKRGTR